MGWLLAIFSAWILGTVWYWAIKLTVGIMKIIFKIGAIIFILLMIFLLFL